MPQECFATDSCCYMTGNGHNKTEERDERVMFARHLITRTLPVLAAFALAIGTNSTEAAPRLLEEFNAWKAYVNEESGTKQCFVISEPRTAVTDPPGRNRSPQFFFVTFRPAENVNGEVSTAYGYPLQADTTRITIGEASFQMYARDESAWVQNAAEEPQLLDAMRAGAEMRVYGTSTKGTKTTDTYSLSGVTAALKKAGEACN